MRKQPLDPTAHQPILAELREAVERLADAVSDEPRVAGSLRGFARALEPAGPPCGCVPTRAPRDVFYRALDEGDLDPGRFDFLMVANARAEHRRARRSRR